MGGTVQTFFFSFFFFFFHFCDFREVSVNCHGRYCSDLYNHEIDGNQRYQMKSSIETVMTAVNALKMEKLSGVDNIPAELV